MISQYDGFKLIESQFPSLTISSGQDRAGRNIFQPIQRLLEFSRKAVEEYNLSLSRKCFSLVKQLFDQGEASIKRAVESSFVQSFTSFGRKNETEKKRLKFFLPTEFYDIFLTRVENQTIVRAARSEANSENIIVRLATAEDRVFAEAITEEMHSSAIARGCGISRRSPQDIAAKMAEGKAVIAVTADHQWVGFSYLEPYEDGRFVSNSGLIVAPAFRNGGVASSIKQSVFELSRKLYPGARIFSITTGPAVMKMNSRLGFEPVSYQEITHENRFWEGCRSCVNYQILASKNYKNCLCTAMLYRPMEAEQTSATNN